MITWQELRRIPTHKSSFGKCAKMPSKATHFLILWTGFKLLLDTWHFWGTYIKKNYNSIRHVLLADLFIKKKCAINGIQEPIPVIAFSNRKSKENQTGEFKEACIARHRNPILCPISGIYICATINCTALAFTLLFRFSILDHFNGLSLEDGKLGGLLAY
jgi:hypothetical protein